jgi:hypothetical protein
MAIFALIILMMFVSIFLGLYALIEHLIETYKAYLKRQENAVYCQLWKERAERDDLPGYNGRIY